MKVEDVVEGGDFGVARIVEVEPEILVAAEHVADRAPVDVVEEPHGSKLDVVADAPGLAKPKITSRRR